jgi:Bacterial protein of unknown function (DUF937)
MAAFLTGLSLNQRYTLMNLVKLVMDQLSGDTMGRLSGLLGTDRSTAASAATIAVPSMLAGLVGMSSDDDGARKLGATLGSIDTSGAGDFVYSLGSDAGSLAQKGSNLLGSLFGRGTRSGLVDSISRFSGLGRSATNHLLAVLAPVVLGKVATAWKGMGGNPSALTGMLAEQKQYIASALPAGFSLGSIPGLGAIGAAISAVGGVVSGASRRAMATAENTPRSDKGWLLAIAALIVVGILVWNFKRPHPPMLMSIPAISSAEQINADFRGTLNSLGDTFSTIKNAVSAQAALPQLRDLDTKLAGLQSAFNGLPESSRSALRSVLDRQLAGLGSRGADLLKIPGLNAECQAVIGQIMRKLSESGTAAPSEAP